MDLNSLFDSLDTAVWVYDFDAKRIRWANQPALALWDAPSVEMLAARDLSSDMSPSVATKLDQYREDFQARNASFVETWTLYPNGQARRLKVKCKGMRLEDGRIAMLIQASDIEDVAPDGVRGVEALLHTTVMISLFERDGARLYCNPAARARFGSAEQRLLDRFERRADAYGFLGALETKGRAIATARIVTLHGTFWHHIVGTVCRDAVTGTQAILISESDVSDAQEAKTALEAARNDAVRTNNLKSDFLATMSHEIRTPVNGVIGLTQVLAAKVQEPEHRAILDMIIGSGEALLKIVNGVLDLSKIESGRMEFEQIEFLPRSFKSQIRNLFSAKAEEAGNALTITLGRGCDLPRTGDSHRIMQVLTNLIGNAVRFTKDGAVEVTIDADPEGPLLLTVSDTGIGMSEDQKARVFESFTQADASTTRKFGGTGLGMSITRSLVTAMSGTIELSSSPGMGTAVRVALPLPLGRHTRPPLALVPARPRGDGREIRILAADDDATNRMVLKGLLDCLDVEIDADVVSSGEEALERVKSDRFDLLMIDICMPRLDGIETLKAIREVESARGVPHVPAIAVTANAFKHQVSAYLKAGFHEHLAKPIRTESLMGCVRRALDGGAGLRSIASDRERTH